MWGNSMRAQSAIEGRQRVVDCDIVWSAHASCDCRGGVSVTMSASELGEKLCSWRRIDGGTYIPISGRFNVICSFACPSNKTMSNLPDNATIKFPVDGFGSACLLAELAALENHCAPLISKGI